MRDGPRAPDRSDLLVAMLVVLAAGAVYLLTLAPTVTSEDSGELITAAVTLGVAHPPGFPLWCLLGNLFSILPGPNPAWSLNFMSSVFGAITAGLVFLICRSLRIGILASASGALLLAFSRHFWSQSVIAEVYTLNATLLCGVVLLLISWRVTGRDRDLYLASVVFGLGLANHYMLMLAVSPALALYFLAHRRHVRDRRLVPLCLILVASMLIIYVYLPLAASADPPLNWGDPSSWDRFVKHVSRSQYRSLELESSVPVSTKVDFLGHFLGLLWVQFTPIVLIPFGLLGWSGLRHVRSERSLLLPGIILLNSVGLIMVLHFDFDAENRTRVEEYYLPAYTCVAVFLAAGLGRLREAGAPRWWKALASAVCIAAPLLPLAVHRKDNDMSRYWLARDFNRAILESLPPGSVWFGSGDSTVFPGLYLQACEKVREDVVLADITGRLSPRASALVASIDPGIDPAEANVAQRALILHGGVPVFVSSKNVLRDRSDYRIEPWGLVYRVSGTEAPAGEPAPDPFSKEPLRNLREATALDFLGRGILADYHKMRGEALAVSGARAEALEGYRAAARYHASSPKGLNNLGSTCAERSFDELAEELFRNAAGLDPSYVTPRANLARLLESRGHSEEALRLWEEILRIDPSHDLARERGASIRAGMERRSRFDIRIRETHAEIARDPMNPALYNNLGNMFAEAERADEAIEAYRKAIRVDPGYALVYRNLGILHRDLLNDPAGAEIYFERYERMRRLEGPGEIP